jgi:hypothetical protein
MSAEVEADTQTPPFIRDNILSLPSISKDGYRFEILTLKPTTTDTPLEDFDVKVNWPVRNSNAWKLPPFEERQATHIVKYRNYNISTPAYHYEFDFYARFAPVLYKFTNAAGDTYTILCSEPGHYGFTYNSRDPTIVEVSGMWESL